MNLQWVSGCEISLPNRDLLSHLASHPAGTLDPSNHHPEGNSEMSDDRLMIFSLALSAGLTLLALVVVVVAGFTHWPLVLLSLVLLGVAIRQGAAR